MQMSLLFWVLMVIWMVFGFWNSWPLSGANARPAAGNLMLFVLLLILGWAAFGAPIK